MRRRSFLSAAAVATVSPWPSAFAQSFTNTKKMLTIVVPFSPGGSTDALGRIVREGISKSLNEEVIVVNQPGAGGSIAAAAIKRSEPDGSHLFLGTIAALAIYPVLYKSRVEYDPLKDFAPVILAATLPLVFVVPSTSPFHTLDDLTAYLKKNGDAANFSSAGNGSSPHLGAELYKSMAKVNAVHVPYKGGSPAALALIGGDITFMVAIVPEVKAFINSGRLRALAVTTKKRIPDLPDIPTVSEAGLPGYEITSWYAFLVRAGTPESTVLKLNTAIDAVLTDKKAVKTLTGLGFIIQGGPPAVLASLMRAELKKWQNVIDETGISAS